jgi:outer membrane protein assembly factor BamA
VAPLIEVGSVNDITLGAAATWVGFPIDNAKLSLAGSWSTFDGRKVRFSQTIRDHRPVGFRLGADYDYKPNRRYYGIGNNTSETDLSYFLLSTTNAEAAVLFGASPRRQVRLVGGYSSMSPGSGYHGSPLLQNVFPPSSVPYATQATQVLWYGFTSDFSMLDNGHEPTHGLDGRLDLRRAVGMRSSDPDYYQWRAELRAYLPVFAKHRVIALRSIYSGVRPVDGTSTIMPFYRLSESRGFSHFAGYSSERYRDQQLMLARVEYRWPLLHSIDVLGLYELGEVAPTTGSFTLRAAHVSFGGGLRAGISDEAAFRFELATSDEGLHAYFGVGSDF